MTRPRRKTVVAWAWAWRETGARRWLVDMEDTRPEAAEKRDRDITRGYVCGPLTRIEVPVGETKKNGSVRK